MTAKITIKLKGGKEIELSPKAIHELRGVLDELFEDAEPLKMPNEEKTGAPHWPYPSTVTDPVTTGQVAIGVAPGGTKPPYESKSKPFDTSHRMVGKKAEVKIWPPNIDNVMFGWDGERVN